MANTDDFGDLEMSLKKLKVVNGLES